MLVILFIPHGRHSMAGELRQTPPRLAVRLSGVKAHRNDHGLKRGKRKHQKQPVFAL